MTGHYKSDSFMSLDDCEDVLREIESIKVCGDSCGNYDTTLKDIVNNTRHILPHLHHLPYSIVPTIANSVDLEYLNKDNEYLEFNIFKDRITYFYCDKDRNMKRNNVISVIGMNNLIDKMF